MALTGAVVRDALAAAGAVGKQMRSFDELAAGASTALRQAPTGLTPAGAAAFLATCALESAWFRTTVEYGTGQRYAPYIGRTFIQLTWEANYRGFGQWCHRRGLVANPDVFVRSPVTLGAYEFAWLGPVYYFEATDLWGWANAGDFRRVSQAVNGGRSRAGTTFIPNGWSDRQAINTVFLRAGTNLLPASQETDDMSAQAEQQIAVLYQQLVTGPDPAAWGWPTWPGGSNDRFTVVDYLRKQNQRAEDNARDLNLVRSAVAELAKTVAALPTTQAGAAVAGPAVLSDTDLDRIAARVVALLGAKASA